MKPLHNPFFVKFIVYFNKNQDFFECHEVLEEYWKSLPDGTKDHPLTAYILLSTGMYHWRRGNTIGALRTLNKAIEKMATIEDTNPAFLQGIHFDKLCNNVNRAIQEIESGQPFSAFPIEVTSTELLTSIENTMLSMNLLPVGSDAVIHKHMLRDRSDILRKRDIRKTQRRN